MVIYVNVTYNKILISVSDIRKKHIKVSLELFLELEGEKCFSCDFVPLSPDVVQCYLTRQAWAANLTSPGFWS